MMRFVPVLPTVTTTAEERAAYRSVGFDQRMKAGMGQFLTYDQIVRKQASYFTDVLRQMRGITVRPGADPDDDAVVGTRGPGSCVTFVVDGVPQLLGQTPNHAIDLNAVGAVEVYSSAERPGEFGGMMESEPPTDAAPGLTLSGSAAGGGKNGGTVIVGQQCVLVAVWTRARLGLVAADTTPTKAAASNTLGKEPTRAVTTFALDSSCSPSPPRDTIDLLVYATVQGTSPDRMSDSAWADYKYRVLTAVDQWAELPSELFLPSFSRPESRQAGARQDLEVTPSLSTVLAFTLNATGGLKRVRVAASSLSDGADTSVLAIVEQAAAAHAFPPTPANADSVPLYLVVESAEPTVSTHAAVLGALRVPEWRLSRPARLPHGPLPVGLIADSTTPDRVTVMMAVDPTGRVVQGTARLETGTFVPGHASLESQAEVLKTLPNVRFDPALVGNCRVNEFVVQSFTPSKAVQR